MREILHHYDEDFFKKYGWVSCCECDEVFYDMKKLIEHEKMCDCFGTITYHQEECDKE
jgi:hypothetical protein